MSGLILEIQNGALDKDVAVSDLLRKALAASKKLDIDEMVAWIENELNGYRSASDLPEYRKLRGRLRVWNPYRGYQPLNMSKEMADVAERLWLYDSAAALETAIARNDDGVVFSLDASKKNALMNGMEIPLEPSMYVPAGSLVGILNSVRNYILNWALELEKKGIKGDGLSFSAKEVHAAAQVSYVTNIGTMNNSQLQQSSSGAQTYTNGDVAPLLSLMEELISRLGELPEDLRGEARSDVETVISQVNSPKPKAGIIKEAIKSLRSILENAAGGILSSDMLPRLVKIATDCGFN